MNHSAACTADAVNTALNATQPRLCHFVSSAQPMLFSLAALNCKEHYKA